jgi:hypothetical protein
MSPLDCPALPAFIERIEPFLILAVCIAAIVISAASFLHTLRRLMPTKPVGDKLVLSGAKAVTQLPIWAVVFVFLHIGGIGLRYRFGPCSLISRLANHSFIVIPAAMIVAQLLVDRHIYERFQHGGYADTSFTRLQVLSWLTVAPLVFILLSVLEYLVRTPI